jgi:glycine/D-amino acid oxidase-like deaminating enzyme/nitrite reductase/ring-hydroxylating ferredoxin subunit
MVSEGRPGLSRPSSLWLETASGPEFPPLHGEVEADVAVLGAGITGVTAALLLRQAGLEVVLIEADRVGHGVTGYTTAKVTSLHGLVYQELAGSFGEDGARVYGQANEAGLARVAGFVEDLEIDCDFERRPAFTYAETPEDLPSIEREVSIAKRLGLPASYTEATDLPFAVAGAVRFDDQAQFHPVRYLHGLARRLQDDGARLFEQTRALGVDDGKPSVVRTTGGTVRAPHVIVATHIPFLDRGLYFARTHPQRSYVVSIETSGPAPRGMYLSTESPAHSIRSHPVGDGELVLVGGESHKTGQADSVERFRRLERYARERFDVRRIDHHWAAQDNMPVDGMPYVGRLWPASGHILTATGFRKWGLAMGTAAATMLCDQVLGRWNSWAETFDTNRIKPLVSAGELVKENANVAACFFGDRLTGRLSASEPAAGEGKIVRSGLRQLAQYRDENGTLHSLSARCSHLGCLVRWNAAEKTWDCPCHGSRFGYKGEVVQGPAVNPLEPA